MFTTATLLFIILPLSLAIPRPPITAKPTASSSTETNSNAIVPPPSSCRMTHDPSALHPGLPNDYPVNYDWQVLIHIDNVTITETNTADNKTTTSAQDNKNVLGQEQNTVGDSLVNAIKKDCNATVDASTVTSTLFNLDDGSIRSYTIFLELENTVTGPECVQSAILDAERQNVECILSADP